MFFGAGNTTKRQQKDKNRTATPTKKNNNKTKPKTMPKDTEIEAVTAAIEHFVRPHGAQGLLTAVGKATGPLAAAVRPQWTVPPPTLDSNSAREETLARYLL